MPLNLAGKNPALVGLGSYIVNAQAICAGCHSHPQYAPGGDPHFGQSELEDPSGYLRGGNQLFWSVMPWPVFSKMTDREKRAIYEYLRAIPCLPAGSARCT